MAKPKPETTTTDTAPAETPPAAAPTTTTAEPERQNLSISLTGTVPRRLRIHLASTGESASKFLQELLDATLPHDYVPVPAPADAGA